MNSVETVMLSRGENDSIVVVAKPEGSPSRERRSMQFQLKQLSYESFFKVVPRTLSLAVRSVLLPGSLCKS